MNILSFPSCSRQQNTATRKAQKLTFFTGDSPLFSIFMIHVCTDWMDISPCFAWALSWLKQSTSKHRTKIHAFHNQMLLVECSFSSWTFFFFLHPPQLNGYVFNVLHEWYYFSSWGIRMFFILRKVRSMSKYHIGHPPTLAKEKPAHGGVPKTFFFFFFFSSF